MNRRSDETIVAYRFSILRLLRLDDADKAHLNKAAENCLLFH